MINNFDLRQYSTLTEVNAVKRNKNYNIEVVKKIGGIIFKYKLHKIIGVSLVHRHFDIGLGEKMIVNFSFQTNTWFSEPAKNSESDIFPISWFFSKDIDGSLNLFPSEFLIDTGDFEIEKTEYERLLSEGNFIEEVKDILRETKTQDIFGLSLLLNRLKKVKNEDYVLYETNDRKKKRSELISVLKNSLNDPFAVTHWTFEDTLKNDKLLIKNKRWCDHL